MSFGKSSYAYKVSTLLAKAFIISELGAFIMISRTNVVGNVLYFANKPRKSFNCFSFGKFPNNNK